VAEVKEAKEKPEREAKSGGGIWATMSGLQKSKGVNVNAALSRTAWYPGSLASWHPHPRPLEQAPLCQPCK